MKKMLSLVLALVMLWASVFVTGASATGEDAGNVDTLASIPLSLFNLQSY